MRWAENSSKQRAVFDITANNRPCVSMLLFGTSLCEWCLRTGLKCFDQAISVVLRLSSKQIRHDSARLSGMAVSQYDDLLARVDCQGGV